MKKLLNVAAAFVLICACIAATSCNNEPKQEDTKKVAEAQNEAKFAAAKESDAQFLVNAAEMNFEEIKLSELTKTNTTTSDVKKLGAMMQTDHAQGLKDLKVLAASKQVTLPTSITNGGQEAYTEMMNKKGESFDKAYCDMMVDAHKTAVDKFDKAATTLADAEIKQWAATMLPALRTHLDAAMVCQKKCEAMAAK